MKTFKKTIVAIITISLVTISSLCQAQGGHYLGYYPTTTLHLGAGFLLSDPTEGKLPFLQQPFALDSQNFNGQTNFYYSIVSNESSLQQSLNVGGYLSVSDLFNSVNASYNQSTSSLYSSSSVTLACYANTDYGQLWIQNPTPDTAAQSLINVQDWTNFTNKYGDNYVNQVERGVSITCYITITNLSSSQASTLSASINGQVDGLGSFAAGFNQAIQSANSSQSLYVNVSANGGNQDSLTNIIYALSANTNALQAIQTAIGNYMSSFSLAKANVTGFNYAPMNQFGVLATNNLLIDGKVNKLTAIYNSYYDIVGKASLLNYIITGTGSIPKYYNDYHNNGDALEATRLANQYLIAEDSLYSAYQACKANPCSDLNTCCNNPVFVFNDALINKFLNLPFSSCMDANTQWSEQYANQTFTFTSTAAITESAGNYYFNCTSTNPSLAGNIVNISSTGYVSNPNSSTAAFLSGLTFNVITAVGNYNAINGQGVWPNGVSGNVEYTPLNLTDTIGNDGAITIGLLLTYVDVIPSLNLNQASQITISVPNLIPPIDAIITPSDATICQGDSATLTANTCIGCSYLWSTGETTQNISVKDSGNFTVTINNSTSSTTSYWSTITVNHPPKLPTFTTANGSAVSGSTTICQGSPITANSAGCSNCTYTWSPGGQNGTSINVAAGTYTVTSSNGCSPNAISQPITIAIDQPSIPTFTVQHGFLIASAVGATSYQWYLNDLPLNGDTLSIDSLAGSGFYQIEITDVYGCSAISTSTFVGINELSISEQISIYPNPATNQLIIHNTSSHNEAVTVSVVNVLGELMQEEKIKWSNDISMNIKNLSAGIYFLQMKTENGSAVKRFVKE